MTTPVADITPIFDLTDRGYRVRAFYLPDTLVDSDHALVYITEGSRLARFGIRMAYSIWNVAAHFRDIVDDLIEEKHRD